MEVCGENFKIKCDPFNCDCNIRCVLKVNMLEKPKLSFCTGLIIVNANIELSKTEIKKLSRYFLTINIALMVTWQLVERGSECNNEFCRQFNIIMKFTATEESWSNGIIEEHNADYLTTSRLFTSSPNKVISIFKRDSSLSKFT